MVFSMSSESGSKFVWAWSMNEALIPSTERVYQGLTMACRHNERFLRFRKEVTFEQSSSAKLRMAEKPVKEKAAPVAPAVAPVVLGAGTAVLFKSGLSAVIESTEDMPSEMALDFEAEAGKQQQQ